MKVILLRILLGSSFLRILSGVFRLKIISWILLGFFIFSDFVRRFSFENHFSRLLLGFFIFAVCLGFSFLRILSSFFVWKLFFYDFDGFVILRILSGFFVWKLFFDRENPKVSFGQLFGSQHRFDVLRCRSSHKLLLLVVTCNCRMHDSKQGYMACAQATPCMGTRKSSDMHEKQKLMRAGTRQTKTEPLHSWDCAILGSCRHVARKIYICT